jgi:hypothetical protein
MALVGNEIFYVQGVAQNGLISGQDYPTTTGSVASAGRTIGNFTITGATAVTITNSAVTTTSIVTFTLKTVGGTVGAYPIIKTITPGTGFTVSGITGDVSVYNYSIQNNVFS